MSPARSALSRDRMEEYRMIWEASHAGEAHEEMLPSFSPSNNDKNPFMELQGSVSRRTRAAARKSCGVIESWRRDSSGVKGSSSELWSSSTVGGRHNAKRRRHSSASIGAGTRQQMAARKRSTTVSSRPRASKENDKMTFTMGALVWAKMKGFPPWPGLVTEPTEELKKMAPKSKAVHCIYFFGTKNYSWIEVDKIQPYEERKDILKNGAKNSTFVAAVKEIEEYNNGNKSVFKQDDAFDQLISGESAPAAKKTPKRSEGKKKDDSSKISKYPGESSSDESSPSNSSKSSPIKPQRKSSSRQDTKNVDSLKRKGSLKEEKRPESRKRSSTTPVHETKSKRKSALVSPHVAGSSGSSFRSPLPTAVADTTTPPEQNGDERLSSLSYSPFNSFITRSTPISHPESPSINVESISENLKRKNVKPTEKKIGFIGLGNIGSGIVKNLLNSGHTVTIWNRSPQKCEVFEKVGATVVLSPADVVLMSDIICCCVSDEKSAKELVYGNCGVLTEMGPGKSYVEMSGINVQTSQDIADAIIAKEGRYLEVRFTGSRLEAADGSLVIMAAGDREVFKECESCFAACGNYSLFLGDVGQAAKLYAISQAFLAVALGGLAEAIALAEKAGVNKTELQEILLLSGVNCALIREKCRAIINKQFEPNVSVENLQKDIAIALQLGDAAEQRLSIIAVTNELFKQAKHIGYKRHDASAVFYGAKN